VHKAPSLNVLLAESAQDYPEIRYKCKDERGFVFEKALDVWSVVVPEEYAHRRPSL
jgi:hypothetical protein